MHSGLRKLMLLVPLSVATAWLGFAGVAVAAHTSCESWADLIETIDETVANGAARDALIDRAEALRDAGTCTIYQAAQDDFGEALSGFNQSGDVTHDESDIVANCWELATNSIGTCGVIAGQSTQSTEECDFDTKECDISNLTCDCKQTKVDSGPPLHQQRVTGCRNSKHDGGSGPCVPTGGN